MRRKWGRAALLAAGMVIVGLCRLAMGEAEDSKERLPADLARVPSKAVALFSVRPADLWASTIGKGVRDKLAKEVADLVRAQENALGLPPEKIERVTMVIPDARGADTPLFLVAVRDKIDLGRLFRRLIPDGKEMKHRDQVYFAGERSAAAALGERAFVLGTRGDVQTVLDTKPGTTTGLAAALPLVAGKDTIVAAVNPAAFPPLPDALPAEVEPFKPLLKARLATLTVNLSERTSGKLRVHFPDGDSATAGRKALESGRKLLRGVLTGGIKELGKDKESAPLVALLRDLDTSLEKVAPKGAGSDVLASAELKIDLPRASELALTAIKRVRLAAARMQSSNNLKQIGLAMHNYHDSVGSFPAHAVYDKDGKPLLSWRVLLLPYLEQDGLYREFKLDEPWDSAHNKKLLAKMPKVYLDPGEALAPREAPTVPGHTRYLAFHGKSAAFEGKRGLRLAEFTDGTSNTVLIAEAGKEVPWTKPDDMPFDPDGPLPKLGGLFPGGFQALFGDGSVRFISASINPKVMRYLITRNGGEVIPADR